MLHISVHNRQLKTMHLQQLLEAMARMGGPIANLFEYLSSYVYRNGFSQFLLDESHNHAV